MKNSVAGIVEHYGGNPTNLIDILLDIQDQYGYISQEAVSEITSELNIAAVDVMQTLSFYHFFRMEKGGKYNVYLNNGLVANLMGRDKVVKAFKDALSCEWNAVSSDGLAGLFDSSCIGMSDQEPAALINGIVFTRLTPFRVREIVSDMRKGKDVRDMQVSELGDGNNSDPYLNSAVNNHIMKKGAVVLSEYEPGSIWKKIRESNITPEGVIEVIKNSGIRGRGGAGFPTGLKWEFCRNSEGDRHYVICNADEGEPGTFKDRVLLTEYPRLIFEGMTLAGYAIGARESILYIRYEYHYMKAFLEHKLEEMRNRNLLGIDVGGIKGFDFDIRIQFGAGSYVCGEESALIESAEGKRGEPRDRPPFPVEKGYLGQPTVVNNVETICSAVKIIINSPDWYKSLGTEKSRGTKILSVSGDCRYPGIYEIEWGFSVNDVLDMVGADPDEIQAVQVGGPSGSCIAPDDFSRILGYEDLATGGSLIIFNSQRDLISDVVHNFIEFFIEESCGSCTPCRACTQMYKITLEKILSGHGRMKDLTDMLSWSTMMAANRCGLGQTAANPILTTIKNFRHLYENRITETDDNFVSAFDLSKAVKDYCSVTGRDLYQDEIFEI